MVIVLTQNALIAWSKLITTSFFNGCLIYEPIAVVFARSNPQNDVQSAIMDRGLNSNFAPASELEI